MKYSVSGIVKEAYELSISELIDAATKTHGQIYKKLREQANSFYMIDRLETQVKNQATMIQMKDNEIRELKKELDLLKDTNIIVDENAKLRKELNNLKMILARHARELYEYEP